MKLDDVFGRIAQSASHRCYAISPPDGICADHNPKILRIEDPWMQDGNHFTTAWNSERSALAEVVLDIDDQKRITGLQWIHCG